MTKISVMLVLTVLLIGSAIYLAGTQVTPAVVSKSGSISQAISGTSINSTTGAVTTNAP